MLGEKGWRMPESFAYEERKWLCRVIAVPVGDNDMSAADSEGLIAYATKQRDMYRELSIRAEKTRTEAKLGKGFRRPREVVRVVSSWPEQGANTNGEDEDTAEDDDVEDDDEDEDGLLDSDKEEVDGQADDA